MNNPNYFLSFLGYPRSGHTLVAAILNANPNVYCSNQLFIMNDFEKYGSKEKLFDYIKSYSVNRGTWKATTQIPHVPKQEITVIGDKTGHRTVVKLTDNPERLDQFKSFIEIPIKFIHVVRNPFDTISTILKIRHENKIKNGKPSNQRKEHNNVIDEYVILNDTILKLKKSENILTIRHEFVIMRPEQTLKEISKFLEISFDSQWKNNVKNNIWKKPRVTRRQVNWNPDQKARVRKIIKKYEWFNGYAYGCGCRRRKK